MLPPLTLDLALPAFGGFLLGTAIALWFSERSNARAVQDADAFVAALDARERTQSRYAELQKAFPTTDPVVEKVTDVSRRVSVPVDTACDISFIPAPPDPKVFTLTLAAPEGLPDLNFQKVAAGIYKAYSPDARHEYLVTGHKRDWRVQQYAFVGASKLLVRNSDAASLAQGRTKAARWDAGYIMETEAA